MKTIAEELGLAFLGIGFDPKWRVEDVPIMPKNRYRRAALLQLAYMFFSLAAPLSLWHCSVSIAA